MCSSRLGVVFGARFCPSRLSALAATAAGFNKTVLVLCLTRWLAPASFMEGDWSRVLPSDGVEAAAVPSQWTFVPLIPLHSGMHRLRCCLGDQGELFRSSRSAAARFRGCSGGVSSRWAAAQEHGLRFEGGGSGVSSRRRRRGRPDPGLELHGDDPRSTFHIGKASPAAEHSIDSQCRFDGDGGPPALGCAGGSSSPLPADARRCWEGLAAMASVEHEDPQGLLCNFLFTGVFLAFGSGQLCCFEVSCSVCISVLCIFFSVI